MNGQVKVKWRTLCTITHSLMVHVRVLEAYIHFKLMYMADNIFPLLPIKNLINEDGKLITPFKLATGTKPSIPHLCVLFCPCVIQKDNAKVGTKALNMRHQAQKGFYSIFVGITQYQKGYLVCIPHKHNILSSHGVVFDNIFSIELAYTSKPYAEARAILPDVSYIPYATSPKEQNGDIIKFTQFEEKNLLSETCNDTERSNEYDEDSTLAPLISGEEMDAM